MGSLVRLPFVALSLLVLGGCSKPSASTTGGSYSGKAVIGVASGYHTIAWTIPHSLRAPLL